MLLGAYLRTPTHQENLNTSLFWMLQTKVSRSNSSSLCTWLWTQTWIPWYGIMITFKIIRSSFKSLPNLAWKLHRDHLGLESLLPCWINTKATTSWIRPSTSLCSSSSSVQNAMQVYSRSKRSWLFSAVVCSSPDENLVQGGWCLSSNLRITPVRIRREWKLDLTKTGSDWRFAELWLLYRMAQDCSARPAFPSNSIISYLDLSLTILNRNYRPQMYPVWLFVVSTMMFYWWKAGMALLIY